MKTFLITLLVCIAIHIPVGNGAERLPEPPLPCSSSVPFKESRQRLDELLRGKQFPDFYQELFDLYMKSGKKAWKDSSAEEQYGLLLPCFYAAKAPLILFNYETINGYPRIIKGTPWDKADLKIKSYAVSFLLSVSYSNSNLLIEKRSDLGKLSGEYVAAIIKCFREFYDPKLDEKLDSIMETAKKNEVEKYNAKWSPFFKVKPEGGGTNSSEKSGTDSMSEEQYQLMEKEWGQAEARLQIMSTGMGTMTLRNRDIPWMLQSMEKDFVTMLVNYFPGKKGEVLKYIRMAGYGSDEVNNLVDRTVGRDGKTEFLYKGCSKKDAR